MTKTGPASIEVAFASLRLNGARFDNAKLPVETLEEIIRYKQLIIAAVEDLWQKEHPQEDVPESIKEGLQLSLTEVIEGSSIPLLERQGDSDFDDLYDDGKDVVDQLLRSVSEGKLEAEAFPQWANMASFWDFGSSLLADEEMQVPAPFETHSHYVSITTVSRAQKLLPLKQKVRSPERSEIFSSLEGRVIALHAENRNFELWTRNLGALKGRFKAANITGDLRQNLGNSTEAPEVLVLGRLAVKGQAIEKIREATLVIELTDPFVGTARRLAEISRLDDGWLDGAGSSIKMEILRLGSRVLSAIRDAKLTPPNIFPAEEGGLSFEWATGEYVLSVELESPSTIIVYSLMPDDTSGSEVVIATVDDLHEKLQTWKGVLCA